jgi:hypothetical protein
MQCFKVVMYVPKIVNKQESSSGCFPYLLLAAVLEGSKSGPICEHLAATQLAIGQGTNVAHIASHQPLALLELISHLGATAAAAAAAVCSSSMHQQRQH